MAQTAQERATQLRDRLRVFAAAAPAESQLKLAAEQALAGDDAAVAAFWNTGYLVAAKADAAAREQYLKDLEARNKAAEELSDLAQRAQRASEARTSLLAAHEGDLSLLADKIAVHGDRSIPGIADEDVAEHLENVMRNSHGYKLRPTPSGTPQWAWWDNETGTMVIRDGNNGTYMRPDRGYQYFLDEIKG